MTTINIAIEVSDETACEILTTAYEAGHYGIGYWASGVTETRDSGLLKSLSVEPAETDDTYFELRLIDANVICDGVSRILNGTVKVHDGALASILKTLRENDLSHIDGGDADLIVQAGLFNEIVYG